MRRFTRLSIMAGTQRWINAKAEATARVIERSSTTINLIRMKFLINDMMTSVQDAYVCDVVFKTIFLGVAK